MDYDQLLKEFATSDRVELEFSPNLNKLERKKVHQLAPKYGLVSESRNFGKTRKLFVIKSDAKNSEFTDTDIDLFIKSTGLPIPINSQDYLPYFIELYNDSHDAKRKWELFLEFAKEATEKGMSVKSYYQNVFDSILEDITSTEAFKNLRKEPLEDGKKYDLPKNKYIYNGETVYYISIDMVKANYNAFRRIDKELVLGTKTWEELVSKFTGSEFLQESKPFRQELFLELEYKRIQVNIRKIISRVYQILSNNGIEVIGKLGDDELIVETNEEDLANDMVLVIDALDSIEDFNLRSILRVDAIMVKPIGKTGKTGKTGGTVRRTYLDPLRDLSKFKDRILGVKKDFYSQVFKLHHGLELTTNDYIAMKYGKVVVYKQSYI